MRCFLFDFYRNTKQKITIESLSRQLKVVEEQNIQLRQHCAVMSSSSNNPGPSSSSSYYCDSLRGSQNQNASLLRTPEKRSGRKQLKYSLAKSCEIKEGACRVGAYNDWLNLMVVSHDMKNSLFPSKCGI